MSVERLIESLGLTSRELKPYLLSEIDEFLAAEAEAHKSEEFGDVVFACMALAWAHAGRHYRLDETIFEPKLRDRLREYGALTRHAPRFHDDRIPELDIGVVHFACGNFGGQWQHFDALQNGTVAEIALLTDAPFEGPDRLTNHCIVSFGDNQGIEYDFLASSDSMAGGNTIRCRIPNFLFAQAKRTLTFSDVSDYMSLQVLAGLSPLRFTPGAIAHFHSWENGFLTESAEFREFLRSFKTIFSPYLTIGRLASVVNRVGGPGWTMSAEEIATATEYEQRLSDACMHVVVESRLDQEFYANWVHPDRVDVRSFARRRGASYGSAPLDHQHLNFITGGRPVREKGFVELCREFAHVREWADEKALSVSLAILCREAKADKGKKYIADIEQTVAAHGLEDIVCIEPKVSLDRLRTRLSESSAVIVPSLYDPYCLMPTYATEGERPAFVSVHAGVSENVVSREFVFDPTRPGDLVRALADWYENKPDFVFEARYPSYEDLYLSKAAVPSWA